ncbi:bifunctional phosphopantothenoylcysteine decarboxylase/phosphopantothenate--cysteine ligase CoaBC [Aestuariibacter salexigens]|uniref:bifunctional phosphopantothenoylcysteine decarboxylase/phosphopantothenate--cysteine ligase CoaBC n=1 Tax=Aestuariibacter salexigens TaxID=226010 RepID=UPI0004012BDD|nr:bifunctional phosphopantothenoylcysteine decarboxylase/phosphopantothenate--cysteine ligase CoaBC [Aestuariibacter salexigens]
MGLCGKNILLGVTGGIAAYKTPDLVRKLTAKGANVRVVLTESAREFVSALALQAVSGHPVSDDLLDKDAEAAMGHIELARWADELLVAPATANFMAKLAHGLADDLLSTLCLATTAPITLAPAMNQQMWAASATQDNLNVLLSRGVNTLGPAAGEQACGDIGPGRMLEPEEIAESLDNQGARPLQGVRMTITAGPTRESLDPVRYLTNHSSGKMGFALAAQAAKLGAEVTLIAGPVALNTPYNVTRIDVQSAQDMLNASLANVIDTDIFIGCAAVADYRPQQVADQKIKKTEDKLTLTFIKNPDILNEVSSHEQRPFCVGFAAETQDVARYARDKMARKRLDMIAANDVSQAEIGFNADNNSLHVFWPEGEHVIPTADKQSVAHALLLLINERYQQRKGP